MSLAQLVGDKDSNPNHHKKNIFYISKQKLTLVFLNNL